VWEGHWRELHFGNEWSDYWKVFNTSKIPHNRVAKKTWSQPYKRSFTFKNQNALMLHYINLQLQSNVCWVFGIFSFSLWLTHYICEGLCSKESSSDLYNVTVFFIAQFDFKCLIKIQLFLRQNFIYSIGSSLGGMLFVITTVNCCFGF